MKRQNRSTSFNLYHITDNSEREMLVQKCWKGKMKDVREEKELWWQVTSRAKKLLEDDEGNRERSNVFNLVRSLDNRGIEFIS